MDFAGRIAWSVDKIKQDSELSWAKLAKILGTNKETLALYAAGKGKKLLGVVVERIATEYGYSAEWLLEGKGEPYPGARAEHSDVCGPEEPAQVIPIYKEMKEEPLPDTQGPSSYHDAEIKISEALTKTAEVLESGTSYATALHLNIVHFHRAVSAESEIKKLRAENAELKNRVDRLEQAVEGLLAEREEAQKKTANATDV